jgi:hypothetical protein
VHGSAISWMIMKLYECRGECNKTHSLTSIWAFILLNRVSILTEWQMFTNISAVTNVVCVAVGSKRPLVLFQDDK